MNIYDKIKETNSLIAQGYCYLCKEKLIDDNSMFNTFDGSRCHECGYCTGDIDKEYKR